VCIDCGHDFTYRKGTSVPSRRLCRPCQTKRDRKCEVESRRRRKRIRRALGLCHGCGTKIAKSEKICDTCGQRTRDAAARQRRLHSSRLAPRACEQCGCGLPRGGCQPCVGCRFWKRIRKLGPDDCWEWTGPTPGPGYGKISVTPEGGVSEQWYTHRYAWLLKHGPPALGLFVLHKCDNKLCCNPAHLYLGTQVDNVRDRDTRGRTAHGERSGTAKLNCQAVRVIRWAWGRGVKQARLAALYHVDPCQIWMIVHRRSWKHVP
jgi:hypothetical protein